MRRSKLRLVFAAFLLAVGVGSLSLGGNPAAGQNARPLPGGALQPGKKGKGKKDDDKDIRPPQDENIPIALPYDRDAKKQLEAHIDTHPRDHYVRSLLEKLEGGKG